MKYAIMNQFKSQLRQLDSYNPVSDVFGAIQRPVLSVPSITEKINAQCLGLGVGFLPAHRIQVQIELGQLIVLPVENTIPIETINMAWKTTNKGKVLRWFVERLSRHEFNISHAD